MGSAATSWNEGCVCKLISSVETNFFSFPFYISFPFFSSSHLTCRGGKDPARFFQEELQGPLEATTHADEGGEGQVSALLSHCKQTHRTALDRPSQPLCFCLEHQLSCAVDTERGELVQKSPECRMINSCIQMESLYSDWRVSFKNPCILQEMYQLSV